MLLQRTAPTLIIAFFLLMTQIGCSTPEDIKDTANNGVDILENAVNSITRESKAWKVVLEETRDTLIEEGQTTLSNEVSNILSQAAGDTRLEASCFVDFMRDRVAEDLRRLIANITGKKIALIPVFCKANPKFVDMSLPANRRNKISIDGYNLDVSNVKVELVDINGTRKDVTKSLSNPDRYEVVLNLGSNGVVLNAKSNKLSFELSKNTTRTISVIQPTVKKIDPFAWKSIHQIEVGSPGAEAQFQISNHSELSPQGSHVITGVGARADDGNLTTLSVDVSRITNDNKVIPVKTYIVGPSPGACCEKKTTVGPNEVVVGIGFREKNNDVRMIKLFAKRLNPTTGKLENQLYEYADGDLAGAEVEWVPQSIEDQSVVVGIGAKISDQAFKYLVLDLGKQ